VAQFKDGSSIGTGLIENTRCFGFPIGTILMYVYDDDHPWIDPNDHINPTNTPTIKGWYSCISANSSHGCPNLVNRFIMGRSVGSPKVYAGSNTKTLCTCEIGNHSHNINHQHLPGYTITDSRTHTHDYDRYAVIAPSDAYEVGSNIYYVGNGSTVARCTSTNCHTHSDACFNISITGIGSLDNNNVYSTTGVLYGAGSAYDQKPAYYSVVFVRRCY
jgi:microcystin-dependent protein